MDVAPTDEAREREETGRGRVGLLPAAELVAGPAQGEGRRWDLPDRAVNVQVVDAHGDIATVVVRSHVYREYLHLVRDGDDWSIVNALWART